MVSRSRISGSSPASAGVPYGSNFRGRSRSIGRAGMPTTVVPGATAWMTTALAPMRAFSPTVIAPRTLAPAPMMTLLPDRRMPLALERRGPAQGHLVIQVDVRRRPRRSRRSPPPHAVVDDQAPADSRAGMDFYSGQPTAEGGQRAGPAASGRRSIANGRCDARSTRAAQDSRAALQRSIGRRDRAPDKPGRSRAKTCWPCHNSVMKSPSGLLIVRPPGATAKSRAQHHERS